ncbi:family 43 glycosylhydrolase [Actinophytocola xanthii]|uniref:Alpha-arabinofuranosidase n=1 Tax=Actinophytocola xanthii TaxID=1912961 RepID=A0A1Q8CUK3_9PSEU|nr:family 43 glycosylhydrolase [Actinophytocola xanthii]OLF18033.1 alpha-arabinofuranosidase [Actinophytocola xanthii]
MTGIDRRTLFHASGVVAGATALSAGTPLAAAAERGGHGDRPGSPFPLTTRNPLVERRADPFITRPVDGMYYLTGSVPEYDRVVVRGATTLDGLASARERTIWRRPASGPMGGYIWAPELHRIGNRWYVYFAAGDSDDPFRIRTYVLESDNADPRASGWRPPRRMVTAWETFTLDATTFAHRGRRYFLWAQHEPGIDTNTNLYIAEMASPLELATEPVRIAVPTASWETQGFRVNEGPAVLIRNGRVFVTFSASATDARYCMGLLTADENANLLDARSWTKSANPIFVTNAETGQFGPGHNSFTVAEDGRTDVLVYHARDYRDIEGDPLFDPNRHTRVQRLHWNEDGAPSFGVPVGRGGPISRLSPMDAPHLVVRHFEYRLRVEGNVRELADTQFRFVPGHLGARTVSLQPVNFPDRYVRAADILRVDPYEDTDAYGRETSFVREPGLAHRDGVSLRASTGRRAYLTHVDGRLVLTSPGRGRAERERSTFWIR